MYSDPDDPYMPVTPLGDDTRLRRRERDALAPKLTNRHGDQCARDLAGNRQQHVELSRIGVR